MTSRPSVVRHSIEAGRVRLIKSVGRKPVAEIEMSVSQARRLAWGLLADLEEAGFETDVGQPGEELLRFAPGRDRRGGPNARELAMLKIWIDERWSQAAIGTKFGVSKQVVSRILGRLRRWGYDVPLGVSGSKHGRTVVRTKAGELRGAGEVGSVKPEPRP